MIKLMMILIISVVSLFANLQKEKISVQLLWKHQFEFAGFYMAIENGYYDDIGLEVQLKEFQHGQDIVKDVLNGKSDFGVGYTNVITNNNITLLNALFQTSPHVLVSLKSSNINKIEDFVNKKIMIQDNAINTASLLSMISSKNVLASQLKIIKPSFNIQDLIEGKTSIASAYLSNELYELDKQNIPYNVFNPADYGFDFYTDFLFTSSKLSKSNPQLVRKFQAATIKGYQYAFKNIAETIQIIQKKYNTLNKSYNALYYEAHTLKKLAFKNNAEFGDISINKLKYILNIYTLMGFSNKEINFDTLLFNDKKIYLSKEEQEFINNTIINVSVSKSWKPFTYQNSISKLPDGISSNYWKLISKKLKLKSNYVFDNNFDSQLNSIKNKKLDLIYSTDITNDRKQYSIFTKKYVNFPISIATLKDVNFISDINQISDKTIAVGKNFTAHKLLITKYPTLKLKLVDSVEEGLKLVNNKKAFGFIDVNPVLSFNINKLQLNNLKISGNADLKFGFKIMIRDDYKLLQSILNKAIDSISKDELNQLNKKWENIIIKVDRDYTILFQILALILFIATFVSYRQYLLNKSNKDLKNKVAEKTKDLNELNKNLEEKIKLAVEENSKKDALLFQQSKLASMGEMIGNIAHQWRQPLSTISTSATGLQLANDLHITTEEKINKACELINDNAQYLSKTIDDFKNFIQGDRTKHKFLISNMISTLLNLLQGSVKDFDLNIVLKLDATIEVDGYENELTQCLMNIFNNSKDAFDENKIQEKYIFISSYANARNTIITVKDNAGGIPKEVLTKIFEPYFTTKHKDKGTGLGLHMTYNLIVDGMNGNIEAANETYTYEDKTYTGAIFTITLEK